MSAVLGFHGFKSIAAGRSVHPNARLLAESRPWPAKAVKTEYRRGTVHLPDSAVTLR